MAGKLSKERDKAYFSYGYYEKRDYEEEKGILL